MQLQPWSAYLRVWCSLKSGVLLLHAVPFLHNFKQLSRFLGFHQSLSSIVRVAHTLSSSNCSIKSNLDKARRSSDDCVMLLSDSADHITKEPKLTGPRVAKRTSESSMHQCWDSLTFIFRASFLARIHVITWAWAFSRCCRRRRALHSSMCCSLLCRPVAHFHVCSARCPIDILTPDPRSLVLQQSLLLTQQRTDHVNPRAPA